MKTAWRTVHAPVAFGVRPSIFSLVLSPSPSIRLLPFNLGIPEGNVQEKSAHCTPRTETAGCRGGDNTRARRARCTTPRSPRRTRSTRSTRDETASDYRRLVPGCPIWVPSSRTACRLPEKKGRMGGARGWRRKRLWWSRRVWVRLPSPWGAGGEGVEGVGGAFGFC
jgi:hypothetical protein